MPLIPSFKVSLSNKVLPRLAAIGRFDGKHPALAVATSSDSVLIHSPHTRDQNSQHETRQLSINRNITALCAGDFKQGGSKDILLIGSTTSLQAYDIESNSDMFFKEVPDGVTALSFGSIPSMPSPLAIVGGNCSIQGFNHAGHESFWTVTGDNVSALCFRDIGAKKEDALRVNDERKQELIVGSEDYEIRIFKDEEILFEITESDVISGLSPLHSTYFSYALQSGAVGVYNNSSRVWHAKSKHRAIALSRFDINNDGVPEVIVGWSNGKLEVRHDETGDLIYKDRLPSSFAALATFDYRMDGKQQLIAVSTEGEVRGYLPVEHEQQDQIMDESAHEMQLKALFDKKNELLSELRGLESNLKQIKDGKQPTNVGMIPTNTKLSVVIKPNKQNNCLMLSLSTNNDTVIKLAMVFCEVLFENESLVVHPAKPSSTLSIPLRPSKNMHCELQLKAVVGHRASTQDHVFEQVQILPRFAQFVYTKPRDINPVSSVTFHTSERVNRVVLWINQAFNIDEKQPTGTSNLSVTSDSLQAGFTSIKDGTALIIKMGPENGGTVQIRTDSMELAGDIIQDLCRYLKIENLESVADFPLEMEQFQQVLEKVDDYNNQRMKASGDIADSNNQVKALVIKAEDARILNNMNQMTKQYALLYDLNRELIGEYNKRANNHAELLKALKDVNHMIQKSARLRMGEPKSRVVAACRKAIKSNNTQSLLKIIKFGQVA